MGREGIRFLTVALVGVSSLGSPAQEEKLDAQALHGRDRAALLNVRTVLLAEKQFAARNGALYGPFECLTKPETCLPDFPKEDAPDGERLAYVAFVRAGYDPSAARCGLLLDEWPELVPGTDVISGVTFNFDRPSSQPPQAMLLAVPPVMTGSWRWDDLVATLTETLDAAKSRAVEPAQIDASSYAQFLPATLMAVTLYQITIATNLALNNHIYDRIGS